MLLGRILTEKASSHCYDFINLTPETTVRQASASSPESQAPVSLSKDVNGLPGTTNKPHGDLVNCSSGAHVV